jgi:NarL family two-component system response regulator LiaR
MKPITVCIVEDDKEIGISLRQIVESAPQLAFAGLYGSAESYESALPEILPDVVLLDIGLPGKSGIDFLRNSRNVSPSTQYLMCTVFEDEDKIFDSLKAGASGYIVKNSSPEKIIEAISDIRSGGSPMSAAIARKVVTAFQKVDLPDEGMEKLTRREKEILHYLEDGLRYKEIAGKLNLSVETIRTHIRNIYVKLQVQSKIEALNKVRKNRFLGIF